MYGTLRCILGLLIYGVTALVIRRSSGAQKRRKYIWAGIVSLSVTAVLIFIPFENLFLHFDSPEAAFRYVHPEAGTVHMTVEGRDSAMVVADSQGTNLYLIVPKSGDAWQVGRAIDSREIKAELIGDTAVLVFRYRNTADYYLTIIPAPGNAITVTDTLDSAFFFTEPQKHPFEETSPVCYAAIHDPDAQYQLTVNGVSVSLFDD